MREAPARACTARCRWRAGRWPSSAARIDLRNHRKIAVIDNRLAFCGSQNCADPEFRNQGALRALVGHHAGGGRARWCCRTASLRHDWMARPRGLTGLHRAAAGGGGGLPGHRLRTGPNSPKGAMSDVFVALLGGAEREVVVSTRISCRTRR